MPSSFYPADEIQSCDHIYNALPVFHLPHFRIIFNCDKGQAPNPLLLSEEPPKFILHVDILPNPFLTST